MKRHLLSLCIVVVALFGAGCASWALAPSSTPRSVAPKVSYTVERTWSDEGNGIGRLVYRYAPDADSIMRIYRFPAEGYDWKFEHGPAKSVEDWSTETSAMLTVNGAYFDENNSPAGLFISSSKRIGKKSFDTEKSGVIELAPTFTLIDTSTEPFDRSRAAEAAQTYPFLIKDGKPAVISESDKSARRTFIGTDKNGNRYIGIVPQAPITLFKLSKLLATTGIDWSRVLNLDGGPSSGLVVKFGDGNDEHADSLVPVPNVIVVERK